jgi:rod shape determining protein RodA
VFFLGKKEKGVISFLRNFRAEIDWFIFFPTILIAAAGLITIYSFGGDNLLFAKQFFSLSLSVSVFLILAFFDFRFLRSTTIAVILYLLTVAILVTVLILGKEIKGAQSWFVLGAFSFQPVDFAKLVLIVVLAKYFSRRHIEIANIRHIFISGLYASLIAFLVLLQPDFGSAVIIMTIWFGMIFLSGVSKRHLIGFFLLVAVLSFFLWFQVFEPYQKQRILTFLNPLSDIQGAGYNAFQSTVAVGSGGLFGKGVGFGTQSRLKFLPEYQTDFVFAAFAEEWGFWGVFLLLGLYAVLFFRLLVNAWFGATNFETLFCLGVFVFLFIHFFIHVGMNIGLLPVTGTTIPFMSYGGSHLLAEYISLGLVVGMRKYRLATHRENAKNEFLGPV